MSIKKKRQSSHNVGSRKSGSGQNKSPKVFIKKDLLTKRELRGLIKYALTHQTDFTESSVVPDGEPEGATDLSYRKSRVLYELEDYGMLVRERLLAMLPEVLTVFNREEFPISHIDTQITASNDGDFFKVHQDNSSVEPLDVALREVSYVYYFHAEPKAFGGGQLKLYDSENGQALTSEKRRTRTITPSQNTLVLFPSSYDHEVLPVRCPTGKFANSRFTVNGWIIRNATESTEVNPPDMQWLVDAARSLTVRSPHPFMKVYLTLEEASEFSGLSFEYLERLVQEERVNAIDDGGWKIRRVDLESL